MLNEHKTSHNDNSILMTHHINLHVLKSPTIYWFDRLFYHNFYQRKKIAKQILMQSKCTKFLLACTFVRHSITK